MSDQERDAVRLGLEALNASLAALGYPPVGENPHVRMVDPVMGDVPNAVVEKTGVAPIRVIFGRDMDIWIGPYSEVATVPVNEETKGRMKDLILRVLRSEVECLYRRRAVELTLRTPGEDPWMRLKVHGASRGERLEHRYGPYAD